ncbi:MAG: hypothetical protein OXB88_03505 [Bacteriovoracales bacterium]|nr:hypothetical protein [Bacteriovoracales bacterium]
MKSDILKFFDFGIKRIYSDIIWIQTLLQSDLEHYKEKNGNSWMFYRFYTISNLDPLFIENYWYGGQYLSVIKDDKIGAKILFEKGLETYPNDYRLLYYMGTHYLIELNDKKNAIKYYEKIFDYPSTPNHIKSLLTKLKEEEGHLMESYQLMLQLYREAPEGPLKKVYLKRLNHLKNKIHLKHINHQIKK